MDIFLGHNFFFQLRKYWHKECEYCTRENDREIILCPVHHNILVDCYKWRIKMIAEKDFAKRVLHERQLIDSVPQERFAAFWKNNRDSFSTYNTFVLEHHEKFRTKQDILTLYDYLLAQHAKEAG